MNKKHCSTPSFVIPASSILALTASLVFALGSQIHAEGSGNRFEKQLAPVSAAPVGEWWKASWQEGWTYHHRADFQLSARAQVESVDKVSFWSRLKTTVADKTVGEVNLNVMGNAAVQSTVIENANNEIFLSRYYQRVDTNRSIFRKPVGEPSFFDRALTSVLDEEKRNNMIDVITTGGGQVVGQGVGSLMQAFGIPAGFVTSKSLGLLINNFIGPKAKKFLTESLDKLGVRNLQDGGTEIDPDSPLLQKMASTKILADVANLALQISQGFSDRIFLIQASEKSGHALDAREIYNEGKDLITFAEMTERDGREQAVAWLKTQKNGYKRPQEVVEGVLQRESFALSSMIFDSVKRSPGDIWIVPADFFNTFLHPDLRGKFRGNVILQYVGDSNVTSYNNESLVFEAREIEILSKGMIEGRVYESTLEYVEPDFSAKLREDADGVLFVDKKEGFLRQANLNMDSDARSGLPKMRLLDGLEAVGSVIFNVKYTCDGQPELPKH